VVVKRTNRNTGPTAPLPTRSQGRPYRPGDPRNPGTVTGPLGGPRLRGPRVFRTRVPERVPKPVSRNPYRDPLPRVPGTRSPVNGTGPRGYRAPGGPGPPEPRFRGYPYGFTGPPLGGPPFRGVTGFRFLTGGPLYRAPYPGPGVPPFRGPRSGPKGPGYRGDRSGGNVRNGTTRRPYVRP
jgi:hypothetical protein